jgi:hypothetical protein
MQQELKKSVNGPATLDFDKDRNAYIDLATLDRTVKLEHADGKLPKVAPVEHVKLLRTVIDMGKRYVGHPVGMQNILIKDTNVKRIMHMDNTPCPVEKYLIQRIATKIAFKDISFADQENTKGYMAVGITYTEKGIQMAFGHNVHVCQNLNIFGDCYWRTYGDGRAKVPYEKGIEILQKWFQNYEDVKALNHRRIRQLQETQVSIAGRQKLIGSLFELAVLANYSKGRTVKAPLNQSDCAALIQAGITEINNGAHISAWDLTNWITSIIKPERMDMINTLDANAQINQFILEEFGIK